MKGWKLGLFFLYILAWCSPVRCCPIWNIGIGSLPLPTLPRSWSVVRWLPSRMSALQGCWEGDLSFSGEWDFSSLGNTCCCYVPFPTSVCPYAPTVWCRPAATFYVFLCASDWWLSRDRGWTACLLRVMGAFCCGSRGARLWGVPCWISPWTTDRGGKACALKRCAHGSAAQRWIAQLLTRTWSYWVVRTTLLRICRVDQSQAGILWEFRLWTNHRRPTLEGAQLRQSGHHRASNTQLILLMFM